MMNLLERALTLLAMPAIVSMHLSDVPSSSSPLGSLLSASFSFSHASTESIEKDLDLTKFDRWI